MTITLIEIIVVFSLIQGLLFGFVTFFINRFKNGRNKYLGLSIFLLSWIGIAEFLQVKNLDKINYTLDVFTDDIPWMFIFYIPMVVYFLKSVDHRMKENKKVWLLTIPFFIYLILNFFINLEVDFNILTIDFISANQNLIFTTQFYGAMLYTVFLCTLSYFIIVKSKVSKEEKKWIVKIWLFGGLILITWVVATFLPDDIYDSFNGDLTYPVWIFIAFFVYWLTFKGLLNLELAHDQSKISSLRSIEQSIKKNASVKKTNNLTLSDHFRNFIQLIENEALYREPEMNRELIAEKLNVSPGYLSEIISSSTDQKLTSIINAYRIEDAKKMLIDPKFDKYSIIAIGLEAGFSSKSAFFTSFKKITGLTPNQFKIARK